MNRRVTAGALLSLLIGLTGLVIATQPAAAAVPSSCPYGRVCVYRPGDTTPWKSYSGNSTEHLWMPNGGTVWNNGAPHHNFDHITVTKRSWNASHSEYSLWTRCLHYGALQYENPPTATTLGTNMEIVSLKWRGECTNGDDTVWKYAPWTP